MNNYRVEPWRAELYHFNQNHDPRTGQFTSGKGTLGRITSKFRSGTSKARSLGSSFADYRERRRLARKRKVMRSGSVAQLRKYQQKHGDLTQADYKEVYDRIDWEQRLNDLYRANSVKRAQDNALRLTETLKNGAALATQIKEMGTRTVDAYNFAADVYNAMSKDGKKWKKIELNKKPSTPFTDNAAAHIMDQLQSMNKEQFESYVHSGKAKKDSQFIEETKKVETIAGDKFVFNAAKWLDSLGKKSSGSGKTDQSSGKDKTQSDQKQQSDKKANVQNDSGSSKSTSNFDDFWKDLGLNSSNPKSKSAADYDKDMDSYFLNMGSQKVSDVDNSTVDYGQDYANRHYTDIASSSRTTGHQTLNTNTDKNVDWRLKSQNPRIASGYDDEYRRVRHSYLGAGIFGVELYHFNPNNDPDTGRFTNKYAADTQYSLNDFSRYRKNEISRYNRAVKADAANSTKETRTAVRDAKKGIQAYDKTIKSLIKDAEEKGLIVESKEVRDIATLGRDTITTYRVFDKSELQGYEDPYSSKQMFDSIVKEINSSGLKKKELWTEGSKKLHHERLDQESTWEKKYNAPIDKRLAELERNNKQLQELKKNWSGDGTEYFYKAKSIVNDEILNELDDLATEKWNEIQRAYDKASGDLYKRTH